MRGRTNINGGGEAPINAGVESFTVDQNQVITSGNMVEFYEKLYGKYSVNTNVAGENAILPLSGNRIACLVSSDKIFILHKSNDSYSMNATPVSIPLFTSAVKIGEDAFLMIKEIASKTNISDNYKKILVKVWILRIFSDDSVTIDEKTLGTGLEVYDQPSEKISQSTFCEVGGDIILFLSFSGNFIKTKISVSYDVSSGYSVTFSEVSENINKIGTFDVIKDASKIYIIGKGYGYSSYDLNVLSWEYDSDTNLQIVGRESFDTTNYSVISIDEQIMTMIYRVGQYVYERKFKIRENGFVWYEPRIFFNFGKYPDYYSGHFILIPIYDSAIKKRFLYFDYFGENIVFVMEHTKQDGCIAYSPTQLGSLISVKRSIGHICNSENDINLFGDVRNSSDQITSKRLGDYKISAENTLENKEESIKYVSNAKNKLYIMGIAKQSGSSGDVIECYVPSIDV